VKCQIPSFIFTMSHSKYAASAHSHNIDHQLNLDRERKQREIQLEVRRASVDYTTSINITLDANETNYSACTLKPSSLYIVTLTGYSTQGTVSRVLENTYYMIHYVALSTLNRVTTYSSSSLSAPVKTVPFDPSTSPPIQIDVTNKSTECISLNWTAPEEIKNIITGFTVRLEESGSTNTVPTVDELNNTTRSIRKCNLKSYTLYTATVSAKSANGILTISSNTFRTVHDPPPRPADPIFVNSSYTTITVTLEPVVLTAGPLTAYRLYVEKVSAPSKRRRRSHMIESNTHLDLPQLLSSESNGILIGVIVGFIILLLIILLLVALYVCWWRKNRFNPYEYHEDETSSMELPTYKDDYDPSKYWSAINNIKESRHIIAGRELVYENNMKPHNQLNSGLNLNAPVMSFKDEYQGLPHKSKRATDNAARSYRNFNRFPHLLPYDHSLVPLKPDISVRRTYINASFIPGYTNNSPSYIAAQSPYDTETVLDFWRLIYQRSIKTIVMITNVIEDEIVKCTQYWPDNLKASYGHFLLHLTEVLEYADYTIRTIEIHCKGDADIKIVKLFEYTSWPDHGVPDDPIPFLDMRRKVRKHHADDVSPVLVHCGTGMGRTGVFIAVDTLIDQYAREGKVEVHNYIKKIRKYRPYMVRTLGQYIFIYESLFEEFHAGQTMVSFDLKDRYHNWTQLNPRTEHSYLRDQFEMLENLPEDPDVRTASWITSQHKENRYLDVIPSEMYRPILHSTGGINPTDYINALFVDGYAKKEQFIVTQSPYRLPSWTSGNWFMITMFVQL
ncbi:hypothetical protein Btru_003966, partial [Bulinus truncatus]